MKAFPMLLIMIACTFGGQFEAMQASGLVDILPLDSVPRELQIPIIVVAIYDNGQVTAKGGGRSGKIRSDAVEYLGEEYPITGVYLARKDEAPYLVAFTPTIYFFLVKMPPDVLTGIGCRYMLQVIEADGSSYKLFIR